MSAGPRPDSAAECLEVVASYLEHAAQAIEMLLRERGDEDPSRFTSGDEMETDLRTWAQYLRANPGVDAALMAQLSEDTNR